MKVLRHYKSKKNHVYQVDINGNCYIMKRYQNKENYDREYALLNHFNNKLLNLPVVEAHQDLEICMSYIKGETLLDLYLHWETSAWQAYTAFLLEFSQYHRAIYTELNHYKKNMILGDMNFRNYIINGSQISRIDYETCIVGNQESDIGKLAAFALTYEPAFTDWKKTFTENLIEVFSKTLSISKEKVIHEMENELDAIEVRRRI